MIRKITAFSALSLYVPFLFGADTPAIHWQAPHLVASGNAHQGPWRMNQSDFDYVDDPTVAMNGDGAVVVAWVDQSRKDVLLQRYDRTGNAELPSPVNVSRSSTVFSWLPRVLMTDTNPGAIYVLWQEIIFSGGSHGGDILFARSTDGGRTFEEPLNLSRDRAGSGKGRLTEQIWHNGSLTLARADDGKLYAAWTDYEGDLWFSRSADEGASYSEPLQIASDGRSAARGPALAADGEDRVLLAWSTVESDGASIRLVRSTDGGMHFSSPRLAHRVHGHVDAPRVLIDDAGVLHLFFAEGPGSPLGSYQDYSVAHKRLDAWDDAFSEAVVLSAPARSAGFPYASTGPDRHLHAVWESFPPDASRPRGLVYSGSADGGRTWSSPVAIPGSGDAAGINGSMQGLLMQKLAANEAGDVAVVSSIFPHRQWSQVRLLRGSVAARNNPP